VTTVVERHRLRKHLGAAAALSCLIAASPLHAEETMRDGWLIRVSPYIWATAFNGNATVKGRKANVDVNFSDVVKNLDGGFLAQGEASKGPWSFILQGNFLRASVDDSGDLIDTKANSDALIGEMYGAYRLGHWDVAESSTPQLIRPAGIERGLSVDAMAGVLYTYLNMDLTLKGNGPLTGIERHFSGDQQWATPMVGLRGLLGLDDHWFFAAQGAVGAISNTNSAWNLQGLVGYSFNRTVSVAGGYRALHQYYRNGNGNDRFEYDVTTHGPVVALTFTW
jgi:hypothetical protein